MNRQKFILGLSLSTLLCCTAFAQTDNCNASGCSATITYRATITESTCSVKSRADMDKVLDTINIADFPNTLGDETEFGKKVLGVTLNCPAQMGIKGYVSQTIANTDGTDILVPNDDAGKSTGAGFRLYYKDTRIILGQAHPFVIRSATASNSTDPSADTPKIELTAKYVNRLGPNKIKPGRLTADAILHLTYN